MARERWKPPRPVRINTPPPHPGKYHGLKLVALGIDDEGSIAVPLPQTHDRPAYLGRFKPEYIEFLEEF